MCNERTYPVDERSVPTPQHMGERNVGHNGSNVTIDTMETDIGNGFIMNGCVLQRKVSPAIA